jgi:hypothetical protein
MKLSGPTEHKSLHIAMYYAAEKLQIDSPKSYSSAHCAGAEDLLKFVWDVALDSSPTRSGQFMSAVLGCSNLLEIPQAHPIQSTYTQKGDPYAK